MSRIQRRGHGRAEIDVAQAHHQVAGVEDRLADRVDVGQVVDATDEFKVARAPWGILAHGGHVFVDGELAGRIVPGQRQVHDAGGHAQVAGGADARPLRRDVLQQHRQRQLARAIVDLQRADAGRQVDDAIDILRLQGLHEGVRPEARDEVQFGRAHFEQQMGVARQAGHQALVAGARVEHDRRGRGRGLPVLLVRVSVALSWSRASARRRAVGRSTAMNCTRSPALSWPSCHRSASMTVTGHTKPPRLGPSGPRITGMSP